MCPCVRLSVCPSVRLSVCSLLWPPHPEVGCPIFLKIWYPWGKVMERSGLRFGHFFGIGLKNIFLANFALQNMVETTLPIGLDTSGGRVYR